MAKILTYNGVEFDLDKINCCKHTSKRVGNINTPGVTIFEEGGSSHTYYGFDYFIGHLNGDTRSFFHNVFYRSDVPFATVGDRIVNLQKVQKVDVAFNKMQGKEEEGVIGVTFKDDTSTIFTDSAERVSNFSLQEFVSGLEYCNDDKAERYCDKDMSGVGFDINVITDRSLPVPEGQFMGSDVFALEVDLMQRQEFIPDTIKIKEIPVETLSNAGGVVETTMDLK